MKVKSILVAVLPVAVLLAQAPPPPGGGFGFGARGGGMFGGGGAYVTGAPFSAVEVVQSQEGLADGNTITRKYQTSIARDGQGRVRTEQTRTNSSGQNTTSVTILDYVGGNRYTLDSATMTAWQSPLRTPPPNRTPPASQNARVARPNQGNRPSVARATLPPQVVNGVLCSGTSFVQTIPAGQIGNTRPIEISRQTWVSNELKVPVQIKSSDPRFGTTSMDLTNIVVGEPSAALFVVPAGYTVKQMRGFGAGFGGASRRPGPPPQQ